MTSARYTNPEHTYVELSETEGGSVTIRHIPVDEANRDYRKLIDGIPELGIEPTYITAYVAPIVDVSVALQAEAGRRILARYPDWYQRNMIAEAAALTEALIVGSWTTAQTTRSNELKAAWAWVDSVRSRSNELEANPSLIVGDISDDGNWPN
jgi:hypothetical protein